MVEASAVPITGRKTSKDVSILMKVCTVTLAANHRKTLWSLYGTALAMLMWSALNAYTAAMIYKVVENMALVLLHTIAPKSRQVL